MSEESSNNISDKAKDLTTYLKHYGFFFPNAEIYGGLAKSWDLGPYGIELKRNLKNLWWKYFITSSPYNIGCDSQIITHPQVLEASGHLKNFHDWLTECANCRGRYRLDKVLSEDKFNAFLASEKKFAELFSNQGIAAVKPEYTLQEEKCPNCQQRTLVPPRQFNLLLTTNLEITDGKENVVYLRPETCQGIFVNFPAIQRSTRRPCPFCQQQYQGGVYFPDNPEIVFCSEKCARSWERERRDKKRLANQRINFITKSLENLSGWDLLTDEEKQKFIEQVNNSESEQFENISRQAKKLIREKQAVNVRERESKPNNSGDNDSSNGNSESDSGYDSSHSDNTGSEEIPNLSLIQSQVRAEQEIEKTLKENHISEEELKQENLLEGMSWKDYLKNLDTPTKVEEFTNKLKQIALKIKLAKQSASKDSNPQNKWVIPVTISVVSLLALTSLVLIIRRRRKRGGF